MNHNQFPSQPSVLPGQAIPYTEISPQDYYQQKLAYHEPESDVTQNYIKNRYSEGGLKDNDAIELSPYGKQESFKPTNAPPAKLSLFEGLKTPNQLGFLATILVNSIVVFSMITAVYATVSSGRYTAIQQFQESPKLESLATYLGLFILAEVFQLLTTLDALSQKNILQVFFLLPFQVAILIYSAVLPAQIQIALRNTSADTIYITTRTAAFADVIPAVTGFSTLLMAFFSYRLYSEFGWDTFKLLGADISIRRMYARYLFFVALLKFDAFFFLGFSIQFLVLVEGTPTAEFIITIISVPIGFVLLILGGWCVRYEHRTGVYVFFVLQAVTMAYFLYKLIRVFIPAAGDTYASNQKSLAIFSGLSLIMLLITFFTTGAVLLNFDKGLKEAIPPHTWIPFGRKKKSPSHMNPDDPSSRMSLD